MADRFYQFDYAETQGCEIKNMGILNVRASKSITQEQLKEYTKRHLNNPHAHIVISHIARIEQEEFERSAGGSIH